MLAHAVFNDFEKDEDAEKAIVVSINTKLEKAGTRIQGLQVLAKNASKLARESLTKNCTQWIATVTQVFSKAQPNSQDLVTVCKATGALVEACKQVPELDKQISITSVKQLIGILVEQHSQEKSGATLHLAAVLLYHYPESCARFQASFSKLISHCVNEEKPNLIQSGAKCYTLLVRAAERSFIQASKGMVGSANFVQHGPENNPAAGCYIFHQINLCNNLHQLMDNLFRDVVITESRPQDSSSINLKGMSLLHLGEIPCQDLGEYYTLTERRFVNLCIFLSTSLRAGGRGGKNYVLPNELLRVVCRGLAITPTNLQKSDESKKQFLLAILPKLHKGLLDVLGALITSFQDRLIPLAITIQRLVLQTLDWTKDAYKESFVEVRTLAYGTLVKWLNATGSSSGFNMVAEEFLLHFLKDISPPNTNIVTLTSKIQKNPSKYHSSPKNSKTQSSNGCSVKYNIPVYNSSSCAQALEALQAVLSSSSCHLKNSFYENVRNVVVSLLYQHYVKKNSPYSGSGSNVKNRLSLLRALRFLQTFPHSSSANPAQYAIQIFGLAASQERDSNLVNEAKLGIAETRLIIHPGAPTLMLSRRPPSPTSSRSSRSSSKSSNSSSDSSRSQSKSPVMPMRLDDKSEDEEEEEKISSDDDEETAIELAPKKPRLGETTTTEEEQPPPPPKKPPSITLDSSPDHSNVLETEGDELLLTFCDVLQEDEDDLLADDDIIISN